MTSRQLFKDHIEALQKSTLQVLDALHLKGLVIDAGQISDYFADDAHIPFRPTPHFTHWCPVTGSEHLLIIDREQELPVLLRFRPTDFWYDQHPTEDDFWHPMFATEEHQTKDAIWGKLAAYQGYTYYGPRARSAEERGLTEFSSLLESHLDWNRGVKSAYEIDCLRKANERAAAGHRAVRQGFADGASEMTLFHQYLAAVQDTELGLPYESIICLDEKSAILHYREKRPDVVNGKVMLIDCGAAVQGYGSDITRTYAMKDTSHATFQALIGSMEKLQQSAAEQVKEGCDFSQLHQSCLEKITDVLLEHEILTNISKDEAVAANLSRTFMPHGLGHMLGIQVHDVSGRQTDAKGSPVAPDHKDPNLRATRVLRRNEVVTIEPGLYFMPPLLEKAQGGKQASHFNWSLIEQLCPLGGIRIEDNVVARQNGPENLTRPFLDNDFLV